MFLSNDLTVDRFFRAFAVLLFGATALLMLGCAAPEPPQIKLEKANILPLSINPDFVFRKKTQFLNDPATYLQGGPSTDESSYF